MALSSKLSFKEYKRTIENLARLSKAGRFTASNYLSQVQSAIELYFNSPEQDNSQKRKNLTDFSPLVILIRQSQRYLSSFSRNELETPPITLFPPPKYPDITDEDLQIT